MRNKELTKGYRRSARISQLEEKARILALQKQTRRDATISPSPPSSATRKRGRKCKSLQAVVVNSVNASPHQEGQDSKQEVIAGKFELLEKSSSPQRLPKKEALEFVLDILQRRDTEEIFAQPVDPEEVAGYYNIIKEPMDFGTMRAKLQEGMYTSLEQFERDVFLISSNAMKFNSSTTVYYTEARAISELAQRLLYSLRTEPENFQLEYSRTRRRPGKKAQSEAGGLRTRPTKPGSFKNGVSLNDPPFKMTTPALLSPTHLKPYAGQTGNGILPGSNNGMSSNSDETERRMTYISPASFRNENEKIVSAVYYAPKTLTHVTHSGTPYVDSLMSFVKDLGPTAQIVANKKLGKYPVEPPNSNSWTSSVFDTAAGCLFPTPSALQDPANLNWGGNDSQMPYNFVSNPSASYKGKMICTNGGTSTSGREWFRTQHSLVAEPYITNGGLVDYNLLGEKDANTSINTGASFPSKQKTIGTEDSMDLFIAILMQISAIQNRTNHAPSGTYYPLTGYGDLAPASSSHINNESQSLMQNKPSEPAYMSYSSSSIAIPSLYPTVDGPSTPAPAALNRSYVVRTNQSALQPQEWKQPSLWGLPPTCVLPVLQTHVNEQIPLMQQQPSQIASTQETPLFNTMNFLGRTNLQGHQAELSTSQYFWSTRQPTVMDRKQPDLDLQL